MGLRMQFLGDVPDWSAGTRHSKVQAYTYINSEGKREVCVQDVPREKMNLYFNEGRVWFSSKDLIPPGQCYSCIFLGFSFFNKMMKLAGGKEDFVIHRGRLGMALTEMNTWVLGGGGTPMRKPSLIPKPKPKPSLCHVCGGRKFKIINQIRVCMGCGASNTKIGRKLRAKGKTTLKAPGKVVPKPPMSFKRDRDLSSWVLRNYSGKDNTTDADDMFFYSKKWVCSDGDHSYFTISKRSESGFHFMELECFGGSMLSSIEFHLSSMPDNLKWSKRYGPNHEDWQKTPNNVIEYWLWVADCVSSLFCEEVQ